MRNVISIYTLLMLLLCMGISDNAYAQKNRKKHAVKNEPVAVVEVEEENISFENLLPSTAKVTFVDSVVVKYEDFTNHIAIPKSAGAVEMLIKDSRRTFMHTNELKTNRIVSLTDSTGMNRLYKVSKLGSAWSNPEPVVIPGNFTDLICPYLMEDGATLYFSAKGGDDNVGGHDIFMTVYDEENERFMTPQNIGLPFNSVGDDLYYIIDENDKLGHLVTTRRQNEGFVCIYSFIPTETRELYDTENEEELKSYAELQSIKNTQKNKQSVEAALKRLAEVRSKALPQNQTFNFQMDAKTIYHKPSDFKNPANKERITTYISRMQTLERQEEHLASLRKGFRNGQSYTAAEISTLEKSIEEERTALRKLATEIRNAEKSSL